MTSADAGRTEQDGSLSLLELIRDLVLLLLDLELVLAKETDFAYAAGGSAGKQLHDSQVGTAEVEG